MEGQYDPQLGIGHSDRGSQYASTDFQGILETVGLTCRMSRKGNCWDNAVSESFFGSLKVEWIGDQVRNTRTDARREVFSYVYGFYSPRRRLFTLHETSPMEFERVPQVGVYDIGARPSRWCPGGADTSHRGSDQILAGSGMIVWWFAALSFRRRDPSRSNLRLLVGGTRLKRSVLRLTGKENDPCGSNGCS